MNGEKNAFSFSEAEVRAVLGSQEGRQLIELLNRDGGAALRRAAESVKGGDMAAAKAAIAPLLQTQQARELMQSINDRKNRDG